MSKAFLRESDFADLPDFPPPAPLLPPGAKNHVTVGGIRKLQAELQQLREAIRPPLSALASSDPEAKRDLNRVDQRIRYLQESLRTAEVPSPPTDPEVVQFGANVTVRDSRGAEITYRLVGVDETALERGWVSWMSPLARALSSRRTGDRVLFQSPAGPQQLEIVDVNYHQGELE
jgi:transcription elongation factor GreB